MILLGTHEMVHVKLSEKIIELRKASGMRQEELAAICNECRETGIVDEQMNRPE